MERVKVLKSTNNDLPVGGSEFAAAKDIRADISLISTKHMFNCELCWVQEDAETGRIVHTCYEKDVATGFTKRAIRLYPHARVLIPSGLKMQLPTSHSGDVRPRSGLALKYGIAILNSPGEIDNDYRGDVGVIITNLSDNQVCIVDGDRIAQFKLVKDIEWEWEEVYSEDELSNTIRGEGGFNSTGTK